MKRILMGMVVLTGMLCGEALFAQGRINFGNSSASPLKISNGSITQVLGTASTAYFGIGPASVQIRLFAGLTSNSLQPMLIGSAGNQEYVLNTASAVASAQGTFAGGNPLVLPFDGTQPVYLQFRANSINGTYTTHSPIILVNLATNTQISTPVFGATASSNRWDGLTIGPLPLSAWIWMHPQNQAVAHGGSFSLSVGASGPHSYQWQHSGTNIWDATNSSYSVVGATVADAGDYRVLVTNSSQVLPSNVATVTVGNPIEFLLHPESQIVSLHGSATFSALANVHPAPTYQWLFQNQTIPGANSTNLVLTNIGTNALGDYSVVASNSYSIATSSIASLFLSPSLQSPFTGATAVWGREAELSVGAVGSGLLTYQWYLDGQPVAGATNATLVFPSVQSTNGGFYSVVVTSPYGSTTNTPAQLVINPANISLGFYAGITIEGVPGYTYGIEYSTNLADVNAWNFVTNVTLLQPTELWLDTSIKALAPGNNGRYYRVTAP
jgi:hypothetical protein